MECYKYNIVQRYAVTYNNNKKRAKYSEKLPNYFFIFFKYKSFGICNFNTSPSASSVLNWNSAIWWI